jgi:predicted O-methyltransferase YrrM
MPQKLADKAADVLKNEGLLSFLFKTIRYPFRPALVPMASRSLKAAAENARTLEDLVELVRTFKFAGITIEPWQMRGEIFDLLSLLRSRAPRVVVEIGTASGGTLFLLSRVAAHDALLVSIDLPRAAFGGGYPAWRSWLYRSFGRESQQIKLLRRDSHEASTFRRLERLLGGRRIDFLMIDGDHSYTGVSQDFDMYSKLLADDGIIAFHDIVTGSEERVGGVPTFWKELKGRQRSAEFVDDWSQGSCGIGIVWRDGASTNEGTVAPGASGNTEPSRTEGEAPGQRAIARP